MHTRSSHAHPYELTHTHRRTQTHSTHACWQVEWNRERRRGPGQCLWAHKNHMQWPYKVSWPLLIIYKAQPSELQSIRSALAKPGKRDWQAAEQAAGGGGGRWDCVRGATSVNKSLWKSAVQTSWWLMQLELQTYSLRRYPNEWNLSTLLPRFHGKSFCKERLGGGCGEGAATTQHSVALVFGPWLSEYNQIRLPVQPGGRWAKLSPSVFGLTLAHTHTHA